MTPNAGPLGSLQLPADRSPLRSLRDPFLILILCAAVYWPWLGTADFAASEGHRVVPGWTMAHSGRWLHSSMFELTYIRKTPGMPWAIAAFSHLFGQNEWSARSVSAAAATLAALACWWFSRKWFGPRSALAAAAAQALLPTLWAPGAPPARTAEIEMLLIFASQLAALGILHALVFRRFPLSLSIAPITPAPTAHSHPPAPLLRPLLLASIIAVACFTAALAKGLAAAPLLLAVALGAAIAIGSLRDALLRPVWLAPLLASLAAYATISHYFDLNNQPDAVRETSRFLWTDWINTLALPAAAFVALLPVSLAMLFVFGKDARLEAQDAARRGDSSFALADLMARALTWSWIAAVASYMLLGVENHRYLLPAGILAAPLVGYVIRGVGADRPPHLAPPFSLHRRRIARRLLLGSSTGWPWAVLLLLASLVSAYALAHRDQAHRSRELAAIIADLYHARQADAIVADAAIEARPDLLLYCQSLGCRVIWWKPIDMRQHPDRPLPRLTPTNPVFLARTDHRGDERSLLTEHIEHSLPSLGQYEFALMYRFSESNTLPRDEGAWFDDSPVGQSTGPHRP